MRTVVAFLQFDWLTPTCNTWAEVRTSIVVDTVTADKETSDFYKQKHRAFLSGVRNVEKSESVIIVIVYKPMTSPKAVVSFF